MFARQRLGGVDRVQGVLADALAGFGHDVTLLRGEGSARAQQVADCEKFSSCADLLESLRAQGEQEFPAIVRRVEDDPAFDYEVISGARRHWSVSYLRNVEHREIRYLIEERELSDEQAFRLADVENRARQDISDYERALDYRHAVETFYGGVAQRMAERLEVPKAWLSRFLDLGKLPTDVVEAFGDPRQLKERHARTLKPLLADDASRPKVMAEAKRLAGVQTAAVALGAVLSVALGFYEGLTGLSLGTVLAYQLVWCAIIASVPFAKKP